MLMDVNKGLCKLIGSEGAVSGLAMIELDGLGGYVHGRATDVDEVRAEGPREASAAHWQKA